MPPKKTVNPNVKTKEARQNTQKGCDALKRVCELLPRVTGIDKEKNDKSCAKTLKDCKDALKKK